MDKKAAFLVLDIDQTKEEALIKAAYRNKLASVNPEDNPEGFKQLRLAYENACSFAHETEEETLEDKSPVSRWIKSAVEIYKSLPRRINLEEWEKLFSEDIYVALETSEECREKFVEFLMGHFYLPTTVWKLLKHKLSVEEDKEFFYEKFAKEFIDFLIDRCKNGDWFPYELFQGEDEAEYDLCVKQFNELMQCMEAEKTDGVEQILEQLDRLHIYHPYIELERARFYQLIGDEEKAESIADTILKGQTEDLRAHYIVSGIKWKNEKKEEAVSLYKQLLEKVPDHYLANKVLGEYYLEVGDYKKAKEYTLEAIAVSSYEEALLEQLATINNVLLEEYAIKIEENPEDIKSRIESGWCHIQNNDFDKGLEVIKGIVPSDEDAMDFYNIQGRLYFHEESFADALEPIKKWISCLEIQKVETEKEQKKRTSRLAYGHMMLCIIYKKYANEKKDDSYYEQALEEAQKAVSIEPKELGHQLEIGNTYMDWGKYEQAIDIYSEIILSDSKYFPAYVKRQKCQMELGNANEVVEDYFIAQELFPGYAGIYEYAAEVFLDFKQYEDAKEVFEQAKEHNVAGNKLALFYGRMKRYQSNSLEEAKETLAYFEQQLSEMSKTENVEADEVAEVMCEISLCHDLMKNDLEALDWIQKCIQKVPENQRYLFVKANLLKSQESYKDALKIYELIEQEEKGNALLYYHMAECYETIPKGEVAISFYEKALEINPKFRDANSRIANIYSRWMSLRGDVQYLVPAIKYENKQLEIDECAYYYRERGIIYGDANEWALAVADFEKALELDPENTIYTYLNLGLMYYHKNDPEKTIEYFQKVNESKDLSIKFGSHIYIGESYERMGEYEKAIASFEAHLEIEPDYKKVYSAMVCVYRKMRDYEKAEEARIKEVGENSPYFDEVLMHIYMESQQYKKAIRYGNKMYRTMLKKIMTTNVNYDGTSLYESLGKAYLFGTKNKFRAFWNFRQAFLCGKSRKNIEVMKRISEYCGLMGSVKRSKKYALIALKIMEREYESIELYIKGPYNARIRVSNVAFLCWHIGDVAQAEIYCKRMEALEWCRNCTYTQCIDILELKGNICMSKGDIEKAVWYFDQVLQVEPNALGVRKKLEELITRKRGR